MHRGGRGDVDEAAHPGNARRRKEAMPLLERKFRNNLAGRFADRQRAAVTALLTDAKRLQATPVNEFMDLLAV